LEIHLYWGHIIALMTQFNLFKNYAVEFSGTGEKRDYFEKEYKKYKKTGKEKILEVEFGKKLAGPEIVLGDRRQYYGKRDDTFFISDGGRKISCHNEWRVISCAESIPEQLTRTLVEAEIRHKAIQDAAAMIHSSGIKYKDTITLFPAWRHTGKTNTMILLLQQGAQMLSDDRLWIDADGIVYPYYIPANILPYNFMSFPELCSNQSMLNRIRGKSHQMINNFVANRSSTISDGINQINRHIIRPTESHATLSELFPSQQELEPEKLSNLVFLQTHSGEAPDIQNQLLSVTDAVKKLSAINYYEWDGDLEEVYSAYDHLFPNRPSKRDQLDDLVESQKNIFKQVAEKYDCYELYIPREDKWSDSTKHRIVSQIENIS